MRRAAPPSKRYSPPARLFFAAIFIAFAFLQSAGLIVPLRCAAQENLKKEIASIIAAAQPGSVMAISVYDLGKQKQAFSYNASKPLKPASVLKILTSVGALLRLSPGYRFKTDIFIDQIKNGTVPNLYVRGGGDPSLTTESLWILVRKLKKQGIKRIDTIHFDNSAFSSVRERVGQRAYESSSAAISFNFNSLGIEVCPAGAGQNAVVTPDPWDLPVQISGSVLTTGVARKPVAIEEVKSGDPKVYMAFRISGDIAVGSACRTVYRSVPDPMAYFAASFAGFAAKNGITIGKPELGSRTPAPATLLFQHFSKPIELIIQDLNHFSTNFIGEQILYNLGADKTFDNFDRAAGIAVLESFLKTRGFNPQEFSVRDGSGLSHSNRLTTAILIDLLNLAFRDERIRPEFENSLSVAGRNGTLRKRVAFPEGLILRGKTGTLNDVSSLAGYISSKNGTRYAFAIIQNGIGSRDRAIAAEDRIVEAIYNS